MIIFYILLIGPGDYFFLRKIVRRMEWTWLSFPVIGRGCKRGSVRAGLLLEGRSAAGESGGFGGRGRGIGLRSRHYVAEHLQPAHGTFNLSLQPRLPDGRTDANAQSLVAWLGLQGGALGGMNPRGTNPTFWPEHYNFAPQSYAMQGVPIQVWSTKSFTGRWSASTAAFPRAELSEEDQSLSGSITNTLDFTLKNCFLAL